MGFSKEIVAVQGLFEAFSTKRPGRVEPGLERIKSECDGTSRGGNLTGSVSSSVTYTGKEGLGQVGEGNSILIPH